MNKKKHWCKLESFHQPSPRYTESSNFGTFDQACATHFGHFLPRPSAQTRPDPTLALTPTPTLGGLRRVFRLAFIETNPAGRKENLDQSGSSSTVWHCPSLSARWCCKYVGPLPSLCPRCATYVHIVAKISKHARSENREIPGRNDGCMYI